VFFLSQSLTCHQRGDFKELAPLTFPSLFSSPYAILRHEPNHSPEPSTSANFSMAKQINPSPPHSLQKNPAWRASPTNATPYATRSSSSLALHWKSPPPKAAPTGSPSATTAPKAHRAACCDSYTCAISQTNSPWNL
jgi:hypothetical protein